MSVNHNGHNSWTLNIDVVQRNDSGLYMCQINTEPMTSQVRNTYSNHFSIDKTSIIDVLIIVLSSGSWCLLWRMERIVMWDWSFFWVLIHDQQNFFDLFHQIGILNSVVQESNKTIGKYSNLNHKRRSKINTACEILSSKFLETKWKNLIGLSLPSMNSFQNYLNCCLNFYISWASNRIFKRMSFEKK